ncbi:MAG: transporter [Spirochaetales bacterium]
MPTHRFTKTVAKGAAEGAMTALWLLAIMLPVSFGVFLLEWFGLLAAISGTLEPAFALLDVEGSGALVFLSGLLINLYSAIATMAELGLDLRETTILALMGLTAHNFLVEIAVLSSGGANAFRMIVLRLLGAVLVGLALSWILPAALAESEPLFGITLGTENRATVLGDWAIGAVELVVRVGVILLLLMISEQLLNEYGVTRRLGRHLRPLMRFLGLSEDVAFLWVVSNTLGLAYGSGVLRRELGTGEISRRDGDLLCHHVALSHSLLEDTLLFVALGVPALWLIVPRVMLALVAVWERRLEFALRPTKTPQEPR